MDEKLIFSFTADSAMDSLWKPDEQVKVKAFLRLVTRELADEAFAFAGVDDRGEFVRVEFYKG
ncbi:MAG: hypothetical protein QXO64_09625, partial [Thermofilaceae archaeon]